LDIKIVNGRLLDGSGNPWFKADVGIDNQRIVKIGDLKKENSYEEIDADGLIVTPGFIDSHSHRILNFSRIFFTSEDYARNNNRDPWTR